MNLDMETTDGTQIHVEDHGSGWMALEIHELQDGIAVVLTPEEARRLAEALGSHVGGGK